MPYELSLEYGTYPVKPQDAFLEERLNIPDFLKEDTQLLATIEEMNTLFHDLFLTIECTFHYIGAEEPEKITRLKSLYDEVAEALTTRYAQYEIHIEHFLL